MLTDTVMNILSRQRLLFGEKFQRQWQGISSEDLVRFWESELRGYSVDELRKGVDALRGLKFPPTLPEFMQLCRPPINPDQAYYEAVAGVQERTRGNKGEWSHPAIFWASASMASDLLNRPYSAIKDQWKRALEKQLEKTEWLEVPEVPLLLKTEVKTTDRARAAELIANLKIDLKKKPNASWVQKNLERIARGEITNPTVIKFTKEAYVFFNGKEPEL